MTNLIKIDGRKKETIVECANGYELFIFKNGDSNSYEVITIRNGKTSMMVTLAAGIDKEEAQKVANEFYAKQDSLKDASFKKYILKIDIAGESLELDIDSNDNINAIKDFMTKHQDFNSVSVITDDNDTVYATYYKAGDGRLINRVAMYGNIFESQTVENKAVKGSNKESVKLLLGNNRGAYIPQHFINEFDLDKFNLELSEENINIINSDPYTTDFYWETWETVLNEATYIDEDGYKYILHQDGDLWLICYELMTDEEKDNFGFFE